MTCPFARLLFSAGQWSALTFGSIPNVALTLARSVTVAVDGSFFARHFAACAAKTARSSHDV